MTIKGCVYKLCIADGSVSDCYIGSTRNLKMRRFCHKQQSTDKKHLHRKVYSFINSHGGINDWDFVVLEECNVNTEMEIRLRERYWIETLKPSLNVNSCGIVNTNNYLISKDMFEHNCSIREIRYAKEIMFYEHIESIKNMIKKFKKSLPVNKLKTCLICNISNITNMSQHKKTKKHIKHTDLMNI